MCCKSNCQKLNVCVLEFRLPIICFPIGFRIADNCLVLAKVVRNTHEIVFKDPRFFYVGWGSSPKFFPLFYD